jgi:S-adenosylmethionine decarboxylase
MTDNTPARKTHINLPVNMLPAITDLSPTALERMENILGGGIVGRQAQTGGLQLLPHRQFGQHLFIDLSGCSSLISEGEAIAAYAIAIVQLLNMKAYGPPVIEHFGHDDPATSGYTLVQLIETSSITGHFVDAAGTAHLDLFSCRAFNAEEALQFTEQYFGATASVSSVVAR